MTKTTQKCSEGNTVPQSFRGRAMAFTSFRKEEPTFDATNMKYLAYAKETCPTTKREHWQSFVYWKNAKTLSAAGKALGNAHCEHMRGSFAQNEAYCSKEGKLIEHGIKPKQGARGDIEDICNAIMNEEITCDDIAIENPVAYHQYGRIFNKVEDLMMRKKFRTEMTTCEWIWGPTGVGKSHHAMKNYNPDTHYIYRNDNGWWEGYTQQETVIINDFRGEIKYNELLQLIDKWPHYVKRRCREPMPFTSKHIIITSSLPPEAIYHNRLAEDMIEQLMRRIIVTHLTKEQKI